MHDLDFETHFYLYVFQICLLSTLHGFYSGFHSLKTYSFSRFQVSLQLPVLI